MPQLIQEYRCMSSFKERCGFYFARLENQQPRKPEYIILDVTHRCNLKCVMCEIYQDEPSFSKDLDTAELKKVIRQAKEWGVREVVFSGGEALLRKDSLELIEFIKEIDYKAGILTNGIIPNMLFEKMKPYLISGHISFTISLDGIEAVTHDSIRGMKGAYKYTTGFFRKLSQLKKQYPSINYTAISVIMNKNLEEIPKIAEFLKSMDVNEIQFQSLIENNLVIKERQKKHEMWVPDERLDAMDRTIDWIIDFKKKNYLLVANTFRDLELIKKYFRRDLKKEDVKCFQHYKTMLMSSDGNITTCFNSCGNVKDTGLVQIWDSEESIKGRQLVKNCSRPCLLPCFSDFRLKSIKSIWQEFITEMDMEVKDKARKTELLQKALEIITGYESSIGESA